MLRAASIPEIVPIARLAIPLAGTYLAEFALVFTDMVVVGRLGGDQLGATSLTIDVLFSILMVPIGMLTMTSVFAAESIGRQNPSGVTASLISGLVLAALLSVVGMFVVTILPDLFAAVGHEAAIVHEAANFCSGIWISVPAALGVVVVRHVLAALGSARSVATITLAAIAANALLDIGLVFGTPWSPPLGVYGAALATSIVTWGLFFAVLIVLARNHPELLASSSLREGFRSARHLYRRFFFVGGPVGLTALVEYGGFVVIAVMMGLLGADALAANQIVFNFAFIISMVCYGIGEAGTIHIAEARGAGQFARCSGIGRSALTLTALIVGLMALIIVLVPSGILAIFIDTSEERNSAVVAIAETLLPIAAVFQVFEGLQAVLARLLKGFEETKTAFFVSAIGYWLFGVLGGALSIWLFNFGGFGVWMCLTLGLAAMFAALAFRYQRVVSYAAEFRVRAT